MSTPLLSVIVPSCGRPGLARTLASIRAQAPAAVLELLVVGDTHQGTFAADLARVPAVCAEYEACYVPFDGGVHAWGQPQRQAGIRVATGDWLLWSQDDQVLTPGALDAIRASIDGAPAAPRLFRVETRHGGTVWREPVLAYGDCDADGICVPRVPERLGQWTPHYAGDWDFIRETVALWDGQCVFEPCLLSTRSGV
jgi:hypothetical protein